MGVTVKELCEIVMAVGRVSDRVMALVVVCEEDVLTLICGYAPQSGRSLEENQSFHDALNGEWDMYIAGDKVMCLSDINLHIGRYIVGFNVDHGVYLEGRMSLVVRLEKELCV